MAQDWPGIALVEGERGRQTRCWGRFREYSDRFGDPGGSTHNKKLGGGGRVEKEPLTSKKRGRTREKDPGALGGNLLSGEGAEEIKTYHP